MIITIGRKPFKGSVVENVSECQCGGINIDATYCFFPPKDTFARYPTNILLSSSCSEVLNKQSGIVGTGPHKQKDNNERNSPHFLGKIGGKFKKAHGVSDYGYASRYFKVLGE